MKQNSITILVPVIQEKVQDLLDCLARISCSSEAGFSKKLDDLGIVHFARWVVIDHGRSWINDDQTRKPKLLFVVDFDGNESDFLHQICDSAGEIIDEVFSHCEKYPSKDFSKTESRVHFLLFNTIKDSAVYIGALGRTVAQIKIERKLRSYIRDFLDSRSWLDVSAQTLHRKIKSHVLSNPDFQFLKEEKVSIPRINYLGVVFLGLVLLILSPLIIIWILIVHFFYERKDENFNLKRSQLNNDFLNDLEASEDFKNQNQFTQLVDMKSGKVRKVTISAMFLLTNGLIKFFFNQGKLLGIPTIHFAKWVLFEGDSRVLFFSNFDGSWQQYLGDFIDNSGWGLTGIFSNTKVFPKTNFLITGGAYREEHFLAWSRNSELVTNYWYSAYPDLSIKNINNNTKIRVQLMKSLSDRKAAKFLKLF